MKIDDYKLIVHFYARELA